jgi:hypothetical protein
MMLLLLLLPLLSDSIVFEDFRTSRRRPFYTTQPSYTLKAFGVGCARATIQGRVSRKWEAGGAQKRNSPPARASEA